MLISAAAACCVSGHSPELVVKNVVCWLIGVHTFHTHNTGDGGRGSLLSLYRFMLLVFCYIINLLKLLLYSILGYEIGSSGYTSIISS